MSHVFPDARLAWADYYFWVPERSRATYGRIYVFHAAHKRSGGLHVDVASADRPK